MKKDTNLFMGNQRQVTPQEEKRVDTKLIPAGTIRQRHFEAGLFAIKVGLSSDRPENGNEIKFWFSTDTLKLSYWTETAWVESAAFS